jgi:hypothetical protein
MMDEPTVQLNVEVPERLRIAFHSFCLNRKIRMHDFIQVLMEGVMAEVDRDQPSRFVRDAIEKVTPAPKVGATPRKVVALMRKRSLRRRR